MRFFRPDRPWRFRIAVVLSATVAAILGGRQVWPRTDEEKVRDVVEEMIEAEVDGDYDDVWECLSWHERTSWDIFRENLASMPATDPRWAHQEKVYGRDRADILDMTTRELYVASRESLGDELREATFEEEFDYEILEVEVVGDQATATLRWPVLDRIYLNRIYLFLVKEEGDWLFSYASNTKVMRFKTLDRKLAAYLPRDGVDPDEIDLVVEVGSTGVEPLALSTARARIREIVAREGEGLQAVIDASADVTWRDYIRVYDALILEGVVDVRFAKPGEGEYAPGVRVLEPPHPSIERITRIGEPR
jgi:hypothetical protein